MAGKIKTLQTAEGVETTKPTTLTSFTQDLQVESISAGQVGVVGKLYLVDSTGGTVAITNPAGPVTNDKMAVKLVAGTNDVTFAGETLKRLNEVMFFQYDGSAWIIIGSYLADLPKTSTIGQALTATDTIGNATFQDIPNDLPAAGATAQALRKVDGTDYNVAWSDVEEVPAGGTTGQALIKNSATDFDASFADIPNDLPAGGTADQVLAKVDGTDYNVNWVDQSGGGGGLTVDGTVYIANFSIADGEWKKFDSTGGAITVTVPNGADGINFVLEDVGGGAAVNNVTVQLADTTEVLTMDVSGGWIHFSWNVTNSDYDFRGPQSQSGALATATQAGLIPAYYDSGVLDLPALTWSGTAPTSLVEAKYRWIQIGKKVSVTWDIEYTNAGSSTAVYWVMPVSMPTPSHISDSGGAEVMAYSGSAALATSVGGGATSGWVEVYDDGAGNIRMYINTATSVAVKAGRGTVEYYID